MFKCHSLPKYCGWPQGDHSQQDKKKKKFYRLVYGTQQWVFYVKVAPKAIKTHSHTEYLLGCGGKEDSNPEIEGCCNKGTHLNLVTSTSRPNIRESVSGVERCHSIARFVD